MITENKPNFVKTITKILLLVTIIITVYSTPTSRASTSLGLITIDNPNSSILGNITTIVGIGAGVGTNPEIVGTYQGSNYVTKSFIKTGTNYIILPDVTLQGIYNGTIWGYSNVSFKPFITSDGINYTNITPSDMSDGVATIVGINNTGVIGY